MWKTWIASSEKWTSIGSSSPGGPGASLPGAATKKSSRCVSPPEVWTSMKPPAPGPVRADSATHDISIAAIAASTAFPPARSTSAPACAVSGWPAATTPLIWSGYFRELATRQELRDDEVVQSARSRRAARAAHGRLAVGRHARGLRPPLAARCRARAEDDVGVGVRGLGHGLRRLVHLVEREVATARDRQEDRMRAVHLGLEQRRLDRMRGGIHRARLARAHADPEQSGAGLGHDRSDVREVEVDQARERDQVRDALDALAQDVVRHAERLHHRRLLVEHAQEPRVRDDDQSVDLLRQLLNPALGLLAATRSLEAERLGD